MKGYNFTFVSNMPYGKMPVPFPGKWPTRITYRVQDRVSKTVTYTGKPGRNRVVWLRNLINEGRLRSLTAFEFDRGSILAYLQIRGKSLPKMINNEDLYRLYHPSVEVLTPFIMEFMGSGHRVESLGTWRFYGPNLSDLTGKQQLLEALKDKGVTCGL